MNGLIDDWLTPELWRMGIWSLQWALLIVLLLAWFAVRAPRTAAVRMLVARMVLIVGLLLPFVPRFWGPALPSEGAIQVAESSGLAKTSTAVAPAVTERRTTGSLSDTSVTSSPQPLPDPAGGILPGHLVAGTVESALPPPSEPLGWVRWIVLALTAVWLLGVLVGTLRLAIAWCWLRRLRRDAEIVDGMEPRREMDDRRRQLKVGRSVQLAVHAGVGSPILVGGRRPWILVPPAWEELSASSRRAVLLHELAHVKRRDDVTQFLEELVRVCFFFHPLVHWLLASIGAEREELCDATVVNQGIAPRELAGVLLECCRKCGVGRPVGALGGAALPFFRRRTVKDRIHILMEEKSMSRWKVRPSRLSVVSAFVLAIGVSAVVGGYGARTADAKPPAKPPASSDTQQALPSVQEIRTAYRANFARLMPLGVRYRVLISEGPAAIEGSRRRLKETEIFAKAKRSDINRLNNLEYDEAQWARLVASMAEENQHLKRGLEPEFVKRRLKGWVSERRYFWTDGMSFHIRSPLNIRDERVTLFPGAVIPPENLTKLYSSIRVVSWSEANDPPLRCWSGRRGIVSKTLNDYSSVSFAPLGFVRLDWTHKHDWHALDRFMSQDASRCQVVGRANLNGRSTILVDGLFTEPTPNGGRERVRAWIDPERGCLPLRLEWRYVDATGKAAPDLRRHVDVLDVKHVAGCFYPLKIERQEYTYDHKANEQQQQDKAAGRLPEDAPPPRYAPGRTVTWEVTEIAPHKAIELGALELEFPAGSQFTNFVNNKSYHTGDAKPLPEPIPPIQPGQSAPPLEIADWTDGGSRKLADYRGKVVVLTFSKRLDDPAGKNTGGIATMKGIQAKYTEQGVTFLEIYGAGSDIKKVRAYQQAHRPRTPAGIDVGAKAASGTTARKYTGGSAPGLVIVGLDGRVAFNADGLEEADVMAIYHRAAQALSIRWPLDESGPREQVERQELKLLEFLLSEQLDRALAER